MHLQWILKEKVLIFLFCIFGIPLEITVMFRQMFFTQVKTRGINSHPNIVSHLGDKYIHVKDKCPWIPLSPVRDISVSNRGLIPHAKTVTCQNHLLSLNKGSRELEV